MKMISKKLNTGLKKRVVGYAVKKIVIAMMKKRDNIFELKASRLAAILDFKHSSYGRTFYKIPKILEILWPGGIKCEEYEQLLAIIRVLDKIARLSNNTQDKEDPWSDIAGYGLLMMKEEISK